MENIASSIFLPKMSNARWLTFKIYSSPCGFRAQGNMKIRWISTFQFQCRLTKLRGTMVAGCWSQLLAGPSLSGLPASRAKHCESISSLINCSGENIPFTILPIAFTVLNTECFYKSSLSTLSCRYWRFFQRNIFCTIFFVFYVVGLNFIFITHWAE